MFLIIIHLIGFKVNECKLSQFALATFNFDTLDECLHQGWSKVGFWARQKSETSITITSSFFRLYEDEEFGNFLWSLANENIVSGFIINMQV